VVDLSPDWFEAPPGVRIFNARHQLDGLEGGGEGRWALLQPGFGQGYDWQSEPGTLGPRFGPELGFARRLRELEPDRRVALLKFARGGSSLARDITGDYGDWDPTDPERNQYDYALAAIDAALAVRDIDGDGEEDRLHPRAILWMQGESDAHNDRASAQAYADNLERLMELLRAALRRDGLPVVLGLVTDSGRDADGKLLDHADLIQGAQREFAERDACAALVTVTEQLNYPPDDDWHYDSEGFLLLGVAFADATHELMRRCAD
jgi:hypothetical protein